MRRRMIDCWIEEAEARKVCEWALAEQPPASPTAAPSAPSLLAKLRALVRIEAAQLRLAFVPSARSAV